MKFKEAYSPRFVVDTIKSMPFNVRSCADPFGGSGTTALTCSLLGIPSVTIEVNPFLADMIEAKNVECNPLDLLNSMAEVFSIANDLSVDLPTLLSRAPRTLCEPGVNGRFVYWGEALYRIMSLRGAIKQLPSTAARKILWVLLGSILVEASNVIVNGKGRRYRGGWLSRKIGSDTVDALFQRSVQKAAYDLGRFVGMPRAGVTVIRGDARKKIYDIEEVDLIITSPPYPNSFDYTDVYNLELWVLGYLSSSGDNQNLRRSALTSHVQLKPTLRCSDLASSTLQSTIKALQIKRNNLWSSHIPEMVSSYFADLADILKGAKCRLRTGGRAVIVIGDSCYSNTHIPSAQIISEMAKEIGLNVVNSTPIRSMRVSAQHGGRFGLDETALTVQK